jgi:hypothetical protein
MLVNMRIIKYKGKSILKKELKGDYKFFIKESNNNNKSKGYGLIRDKNKLAPEIASIASVGYGLAALVIGVERKWITYKKAFEKADKTLDTFLNNLESTNGFFYHFLNIETSEREWNSEVSIIDTAIFICGAIFVGEYFEGKVKEKAELLYKQINWNWYADKIVNQFYMGYSKERGFWGHWDMYAEQLMLYVLGVASPTYPIEKILYDSIKKEKRDYFNTKDIVYTYCGTLFTYQYSHAWIDFRGLKDKDGIDWFDNSKKATLANREYCIRNSDKFKTFNKNSWGLTACVGPKGYSGGFGAMPALADVDKENDGTIAPCGAIGSIVFTPELSIKAVENYYNNFPKLWGKYGFKDAYNLDIDKPWYAEECIGIDKGISMLMIENYFTGLIWKYFMKNKYVKKGLELLGFTKEKEIIKI